MDPSACAALVLAAGRGRRMGQDKALLDLGGVSAIERVVRTCRAAGVGRIVVVREAGAATLPSLSDPEAPPIALVEVASGGAMTDSICAGRNALPDTCRAVVILAVDHAMVAADTVVAVLSRIGGGGCEVALPLYRERPGHPLALSRAALAELGEERAPTLRHVVRADPARVKVVGTNCRWTVQDLDTPADLRAAQAALREGGWPVQEQMLRHRSRRQFGPEPVGAEQVRRLVDAARHASTSSFIQAFSVVVVQEDARKEECARLCGDQAQIGQAPLFLAVCADVSRLARACGEAAYGEAGGGFAEGDFELFVQATVDAALVAQNLQLAAEAEGLGACMIGAARNHPVELAGYLGLPPHVYVVMGMTMGHPVDDPVPRTRMPLGGVLHWEHYDSEAAWSATEGADVAMRAWARAVNERRQLESPGNLSAGPAVDESKGWRDRMARMWRPEGRYVQARAGLRHALVRLRMLRSQSGDSEP